MLIQLPRASRNRSRLVRHTLQIRRKLHCGYDPPQIGGDWLKSQQNCDAILIDLYLQLVDLFIIGNQLRIRNARCSDGGRGSLMPDVFRGGGVNGVLGNVGGMIAHAFEAAANKNQI